MVYLGTTDHLTSLIAGQRGRVNESPSTVIARVQNLPRVDCSASHARLLELGTLSELCLGVRSEFLPPVKKFQICFHEEADAWHLCPSRGGLPGKRVPRVYFADLCQFTVKMARGKGPTRGILTRGKIPWQPCVW